MTEDDSFEGACPTCGQEYLKRRVVDLEARLLEIGHRVTTLINSRYLTRRDIPISDSMYRMAMYNFTAHNDNADASERRDAMRDMRTEELHQEKLRMMREGKKAQKKKPVYASSRIPPMESVDSRDFRDLLKGRRHEHEESGGAEETDGIDKGGALPDEGACGAEEEIDTKIDPEEQKAKPQPDNGDIK